MGYPSLPNSVDRYVRQMLDTMAGRTGRTGDRVVTYDDLTILGLASGNTSNPSRPGQNVGDILKPTPGGSGGGEVIVPLPVPDTPTTPEGLKSTGIFGAIILEWLPPTYNGHSHTEIHRAQINDLSQATMTHQAKSNSYTDIANHGITYYYWIRHVNIDGLKSQFNQVAGTPGQATADPTVIQEAVQGVIDNSYFTPGWAAHTEQQEQILAQAEQDLRDAEQLIDGIKTDIGQINTDIGTIDIDLATIKTGLTTETTERKDADSALTSSINTVAANLSTETQNRIAAIRSEQTARVDGDEALGRRVDTVIADLSTETENRKAAIQSEQTARVSADNTLDGKITAEASRVDQVISDLSTETQNRKAAVASEASTRASEDEALAERIDVVSADLSTETQARKAAVASEASARADADTALGQRVDQVSADLSTETTERKAAITTVTQAQVDGDTALSQQLTQLTAKVGDNESSITSLDQVTEEHASRIIVLESNSGGDYGSAIKELQETTAEHAQQIVELETSEAGQNSKITTLEQTTANQATQLTSLTSTVGNNTSAINEQKTVTDGLKAEYTLKVTQEGADGKPIIAGIGVASGQNEDGETFSEIAMVAENFFFSSPNGLHSPFSIVDIGSGDYKISMNADVLINGSLNISQLESGELKQGTALTVGRSSIELSTASDGTGQLIIAGDGGIQNNDYMIMNAGRIQAYVFVPGVGHVPYKEVKRVETGTANSGQQVKIPAYFRSQPTIHLYPRDMSVYNADYPNQSQKIEMYYSAPQPHPTEDGAWLFTPYAKLVLASGSEVVSPGWTYTGSSNSQTWTSTNISNLKAVTVDCRCASYRRTTGTTYQNRQVTVYLDYKLSSSSAWSVGDSEVVSINQFTTHTVQLSKTLSQNTYDIRVRFVAADRSGTFTDGNPTYDYTQQGKTGTPWTKTVEPIGLYSTKTQFITINSHTLSGWEIIRIDYNVTVDIVLKVRNVYDRWTSGNLRKGKARVKIPDGNAGYSTYEVTTSNDWIEFGNPWEEYATSNVSIQWSDTNYKDGKIHPAVEIYAFSGGYTSSGTQLSSSHAHINVKSIAATVYYRRQQSNPQTYNNYYMDSARYDKSATDISLDVTIY